jgi:glyoxalase family protein
MALPHEHHGIVSIGTVHHVAFRVGNDNDQLVYREKIKEANPVVTSVINRNYFHSIYFREPGGVLFEIATDPPGFTVDESLDKLGTGLMLPPWLETDRNQIVKMLPKVRLPRQLTTAEVST